MADRNASPATAAATPPFMAVVMPLALVGIVIVAALQALANAL